MVKDEKNLKNLDECSSENVSGGYANKSPEEVKKLFPNNDNSSANDDIDPAVMPPFNPFMFRHDSDSHKH